MKKLLLTFLISSFLLPQLFAQNVGIGTTTPQSKLEVRGGAVGISSSTKRYELNYDSTGGYFYVDEFGAARHLVIKNGGNIGIGTTNPQSKLDVAGQAEADSFLVNRTVASNSNFMAAKGLVTGTDILFDGPGTPTQVSTSVARWQSFTAGETGILNFVKVKYIGAFSASSTSFSIIAGEGLLGTTLFSGTITKTSNAVVSSSALNIPITKGNQYTIVLGNGGNWQLFSGNNYPDGISSYSNFFDYYFETIVTSQQPLFVVDKNGNLGLSVTNPTARLDINGSVQIANNNALEFGKGITKETNAGKIAYQQFSQGLDIVGAGTNSTNRKITLFGEGGITLNGNVDINGDITGNLKINGLLEATGIKLTNGAGLGKTLVSDATGNATWQAPMALFRVRGSNDQAIPTNGSFIDVSFLGKNYDPDNIIPVDSNNLDQNIIAVTIPQTGYYQLNINISVEKDDGDGLNSGQTSFMRIVLLRNNVEFSNYQASTNTDLRNIIANDIIYLQANDLVKLRLGNYQCAGTLSYSCGTPRILNPYWSMVRVR